MDKKDNPMDVPGKVSALVEFSDGSKATVEGASREDIIDIRNKYEDNLEAARMEARESKILETMNNFQNSIVTTPIGHKPRNTQEVRQEVDWFTGAPIRGTGLTEVLEDGTIGPNADVASNNPGKLHAQAWEQGVDVERGAPLPARFVEGLTALKSPELQVAALTKWARKNLMDNGVDVDLSITPVWKDENTGKIMLAMPITEQDVQDHGESSENVGKVRMVMADELGMDFGDIVEFLPDAPVVAASVAATALATTLTRSPEASLAISSAVNGALAGVDVAAKNQILESWLGFTPEEIEAASDPDEAIMTAVKAGGAELALGGILQAVNKFRRANPNRVLTKDDVKELANNKEELDRLLTTLDEWTGGVRLSDAEVVQSLGTYSGTEGLVGIGQRAADLQRKLGIASRRADARLDASNRLRVATGLANLTDNAITEGTDPTNLARLHREGLLQSRKGKGGVSVTSPREGAPQQQRVDDVGDKLRAESDLDGVGTTLDSQAADAQRTLDAQDKALEQIERRRNDLTPDDIIRLTDESVEQAQRDAAETWYIFEDTIGYNYSTNTSQVGLKQSSNSPINRELNRIEREAEGNLSQVFGARGTRLVEDLEALRKGEVLDVNALVRLDAQLGAEIRAMQNAAGAANDGKGFDAKNLREMQKAIRGQMERGNWVDVDTGEAMSKAWQSNAMDQLSAARDATYFNASISTDSTVQQLIKSRPVLKQSPSTVAEDGTVVQGTMRRTGEYEFSNMSRKQANALIGDPNVMSNVYRTTRDNPQVKAAMANELKEQYLSTVGRDTAEWTQTKHNAFMKKYRPQLDLTFGPEDAARINNAETLGAAVAKSSARATRMTNLFTERFGKDFVEKGGLNAKSFADHVLSTSTMNTKQLARTMDEIKRIDPDLHIQLKAEVGANFIDKISSGALLHGNGDALNKLIKSEGPVIEAVLGKQYLKDITKFRDVLKVFQHADQSKALAGEPIQPAWLQITRSLMGPLSRKQRFLTSYNRISRGYGNRGLLDMMADPKTMQQFMKLEKMTPFTASWSALVSRLGLQELLSPEDQERMEEVTSRLPTRGMLRDQTSELTRMKMGREAARREKNSKDNDSATSGGKRSRGYTRERH